MSIGVSVGNGVFPSMDEMAWFDDDKCRCSEVEFDLIVYGNHFCKDGTRINPEEVEMGNQNILIEKGYFVAGEHLEPGDAVYIDEKDGKLKKAKEVPYIVHEDVTGGN